MWLRFGCNDSLICLVLFGSFDFKDGIFIRDLFLPLANSLDCIAEWNKGGKSNVPKEFSILHVFSIQKCKYFLTCDR